MFICPSFFSLLFMFNLFSLSLMLLVFVFRVFLYSSGKTTVAMKMGQLYKEMGFISSGHTVQATRADLVGQYIGHTGPKTKEMITRSFGGILFIDEAYGTSAFVSILGFIIFILCTMLSMLRLVFILSRIMALLCSPCYF